MNAYWAQWSLSELMSMQDVEMESCCYDNGNYHDDIEGEEHTCFGCMYCLNLSWKDFM
jgi:hypothetical protein